MTIECPICYQKFRSDNNYLKHLEKNHENQDCGCQGGGKKMKNFENVLKNAKEKIDKIESNIQMNSITYGLKIHKKDLDKIPLPLKEKIKSIGLENEFLKGTIKAQEKQIRLMKTQIDKCIKSIGIHYEIK